MSWAEENGNKNMFQLLAEKGVKLDTRDDRGRKTLQDKFIVQLLVNEERFIKLKTVLERRHFIRLWRIGIRLCYGYLVLLPFLGFLLLLLAQVRELHQVLDPSDPLFTILDGLFVHFSVNFKPFSKGLLLVHPARLLPEFVRPYPLAKIQQRVYNIDLILLVRL